MFFDGTGDKLSVPNSADVRLGSNDFTVEAWVKFGDVSGYWDAIIGMWDSSNSRRTFNLQRYKSGGADNDGYLYIFLSCCLLDFQISLAISNVWRENHQALVR